MKNRFRLVLAVAAALLLATLPAALLAHAHESPAPSAAGLFLVDRSDDDASAAAQVCSLASGDCSLRGAIIKANANPGSSVVLFAGQSYTLSIPASGGDDATNGDLNLTADMTVTTLCLFPPCGPTFVQGAAGWTDRIFTVLDGQVQIRGVTVRGGTRGVYVGGAAVLTLTNSIVTGNTADDGAGIQNHGQLFLQNSQVISNSTPAFGGGIYSGPGSYLELNSSVVSSNTASSGGGLFIHKGTLVMQDSEVANNTVAGGAGGIGLSQGSLTLESSRVFSNTAVNGFGGGIMLGPTATADIHNSSIGWNVAGYDGGALYLESTALTLTASTVFSNTSGNYGGGLAIELTSTAQLVNSTISGNRVKWNGGGIFEYLALTTTLTNVTVAYNVANKDGNSGFGGGGIWNPSTGAFVLLNSIVADNKDLSPFMPAPDCKGTLLSDGYNLIGDSSGCTLSGDTMGNQLNVDPHLGPLRNNGGSTWTHALRFDSPAVDTASPSVCLVTDQRGALRPYNGSGQEFAWCDIGAFEYNGPQLHRLFLPLIRR